MTIQTAISCACHKRFAAASIVGVSVLRGIITDIGRIDYAMDNQFHALLDPSRHRYSDGVKTRSKTPALMRTCSQLRIEASNIWYSETIFVYKLDSVSLNPAS